MRLYTLHYLLFLFILLFSIYTPNGDIDTKYLDLGLTCN
ncbi:hypothetical protein BGAFAR04_F0006 (plasmid) [Borreliella garinii Far04]|nr:hypothetical protein BGAFAR04_F0006 [Borreliella garinii Far04]